MDINPYKFKANFEDFEWAVFQKSRNSNLLFLSNAWLLSKEGISSTIDTIEYWGLRMLPLIESSKNGSEITVCISNRIGTEE